MLLLPVLRRLRGIRHEASDALQHRPHVAQIQGQHQLGVVLGQFFQLVDIAFRHPQRNSLFTPGFLDGSRKLTEPRGRSLGYG